MNITAPPPSESCAWDDHGTCFPDEPADCGCDCHPLDDVAGTPQPGARHVPDPAHGIPRAGRAAPSGRPAAAPAPRGAAAGGKTQDREGGLVPAGFLSLPGPDMEPPGPAPQTPAGSALDADGASSGRPRTYTIALPPGLALLSLNDRLHWRDRYSRAQVIKDAACTMARRAKVPRLRQARIAVEYQPPDRRHRDADNPVASAKAAVDGIVMAGVLDDDECPRYVTGIWCTIGPLYPKGRLVLHLTEVAATAGDAA